MIENSRRVWKLLTLYFIVGDAVLFAEVYTPMEDGDNVWGWIL